MLKTIIFACANEFDRWPQEDPLAGLSGDRRPQTPLGASQHTDLGRAIFFLLKAGWAGLLMETSQMGSKPLVLLMQINFWGFELLKTIIFACANGTDGPQTIVFACPNVHSFLESH